MGGFTGIYSQYSEYRYGEHRGVTLPGRVRAQPLFKGAARKAIVDRIVEVLRDWRSSRFENEAATLHGIRSTLVLRGYSWNLSGHEARSIVDSAFAVLGYKRPSWLEGQREYATPSENCKRCGSPVPEELLLQSTVNFCSDVCARSARSERLMETYLHTDEVYRATQSVIKRSKFPKRTCKTCGKRFRPLNADGVYCGKACVPHIQRQLPDIDCPNCGSTFRPVSRHTRFCSHDCASKAKIVLPEKACVQCGSVFKPQKATQLACSYACARKSASEPVHTLNCQCCGTTFKSSRKHALYCGKSCQAFGTKLKNPKFRHKNASARVIDYLIIQAGGTIRDAVQPVP